jgi:Leucine-rich repeat (LRR) protein
MGRLKRIQRIDAANNVLTRVPPSMGHLKSIKELNLKYNNLADRYKTKAEEGLSRWVLGRCDTSWELSTLDD